MKIFEKIKDGRVCFLETLFLCSAFCLPHVFNLQAHLQGYTVDPTGFFQVIWNYALQHGNTQLGLFLSLIMFVAIRKKNEYVELNTERNIYHDWPLVYYWYCSRVLGIKKCWVVGVPIPRQIQIFLRGYYRKENLLFDNISSDNKDVKTTVQNYGFDDTLLILQDTYKIKKEQYPPDLPKERLRVISIDNCLTQGNRQYNKQFVLEVMKQVKALPERTTLYIAATTNPKHNIELAEKVFSVAERSNIKSLYVYQQERSLRKVTGTNIPVNRLFIKREKIF